MIRPTADQREAAIRGLIRDLETAKVVVPLLEDHARRERWHPDGRLPTAKVVCEIADCSGRPHGTLGPHAARLDEECQLERGDPTGEAVIGTHPSVPSYDRDRLDDFHDALATMIVEARAVLGQLPTA